MKIVKVINSLDFGGIEKVFEIVAKYYSGDKRDLIFVSLGEGGKAALAIEALGYDVITLKQNTKIPNFRVIRMLFSMLRKIKPDVVHTCGAEGNFHGLVAAWLARVPVRIGEEIGMPSHSATAKKIFRIVYYLSSGVIVVANSVRDYIVRNGEARQNKIHLIYNPVDADHYGHVTPEQDKQFFTFVTVCRLHPIKNLDRLINCFARISNVYPHARLWLVGDGPARQALEEQVKNLKLGSVVSFFGFQPDPKPYYAKADVFVLPSLSEGHPVSLIEAMICGIPSVSTNVGGAVEIIEHGKSGWLINPLDEDNIVGVLTEVIATKKEHLKQVSEEAKAFAERNFLPHEYFVRLDRLYNSLSDAG